MSKTHRSDTAFIPGYHHSGDRGLGVSGDQIPSTGTHGPALPYPSLDLPADANKEIRVVVTSWPAGVTILEFNEDGGIVAQAPDGVYTGTFDLYADGQSVGSSTFTLTFGDGLNGTITIDNILASGQIDGVVAPLRTLGRANGPRVGLTAGGDLILLF